jgi:predicted RNA binding protein YcfA (HicA-like mRNA interferase family)
MGKYDFNRDECIFALKKLGFVCVNKRMGNHDKYKRPSDSLFIMVPRHRVLYYQKAILNELKRIGGDELENRFLELV